MNGKKILRMGVVGCGAMGGIHAHTIARSDCARLIGVCDLDPRKSSELARELGAETYFSVTEMCDRANLDGLVIATPDDQHADLAMLAIQRGLHVFCEKPLAQDLPSTQRIRDMASTAGVSCGVNYNRRFGFAYQAARRLLEGCRPPRQATIQIVDALPSKVADIPYAILNSLVSHHLDLVRWLGGEVESLQAVMDGPTDAHPHHVAMLTQSTGGMIASVNASWRPRQNRTSEWSQWVSDDCVIVAEDVQRRVSVWDQSPDEWTTTRPDYFLEGSGFYDTARLHLQAFLSAIIREKTPPVTADDACATARMIAAAIESHRSRRRIDLDGHFPDEMGDPA